MRKCSRISDPSSLQQCKETFNLYYYDAESDFANQQRPTWDPTAYRLVDKVAADYLFEMSTDVIKVNKETRRISLSRGLNGVYIAFQDKGACVTLISLRVYYVTCPNTTVNYAFFNETATGDEETPMVDQLGQCVENAVEVIKPSHICQNTGAWFKDPKGKCECDKGYQGNNVKTQCLGEFSFNFLKIADYCEQ